MSKETPESMRNTMLRRSETTLSLVARYVGVQRGMVRWVDPIVNAISDLYDPSKGGYDAKTLKVGLLTGEITR